MKQVEESLSQYQYNGQNDSSDKPAFVMIQRVIPSHPIRKYITLVEGLFLVEHNVVNLTAIDAFVKKFIMKTKPEAGKIWFQKKLRSLLMNDDKYLMPMSRDDVASYDNLPDYFMKAIERGETLYFFDPANNYGGLDFGSLTQRMNHVVDWFNALATVASRNAKTDIEIEDKTIAEKWLERLNKIPITEITEVADTWFSKMGTRIKAEKDGVEIVYNWSNGFYAVRYTDLNTMKSDGRDLQNCLQNGMYWKNVQSGHGAVFGIRKPNDEAVVGIRIQGKRLEECKGKNNKPVSEKYIPYVIDFITSLGVDVENNYDLKSAGIETSNGKMGKFEDIADVVYDNNNIKVWQTTTKFLAKVKLENEFSVTGALANGVIGSIDVNPNNDNSDPSPAETSEVLLKVLQILHMPPSDVVGTSLELHGIFYFNGRYGDIKTVGKQIYSNGEVKAYLVSSGEMRTLAFIFLDDMTAGRILINDEFISDFFLDYDDFNVTDVTLIDVLNALKKKPSVLVETNLITQKNIYWDGKVFGTLEDLGKLQNETVYERLYALGKSTWFVTTTDGKPIAKFWKSMGVLKHKILTWKYISGFPGESLSVMIRKLALKYKCKSVDQPEQFSMINTKEGLIADFDSFIKVSSVLSDVSYTSTEDTSVYLTSLLNKKIIETAAELFVDDGSTVLTSEQQKKVYDVFRSVKPEIITDEPDFIYDIQVKNEKIMLPDSNILLALDQVITDGNLRKSIEKDTISAINKAITGVKSYQYANIDVLNISFGSFDNANKALENLKEICNDLRRTTRQAIRDRKSNPDKYAKNLSSRFAAMNAFRKNNLS